MGAQKDTGFGGRDKKEWIKYEDYRPAYPPSFFDKIYEYHGQRSGSQWQKAVDVGAGAGIVSGPLADRFKKVAVVDPSEGYTSIARARLVDELGLPESSFEFLQEGAERSSLPSDSVDLVTACTCLHWADTAASLKEFYRILKPGGTVFVANYTVPRIVGNPLADELWHKFFHVKISQRSTPEFARAVLSASAGLTDLEMAEEQWTDIRRVFINTDHNMEAFDLSGKPRVPDKTGPNDHVAWLEDDQDWAVERDWEWLQGFDQTFEPVLPIEAMQEHWDKLERALGDGKQNIATQVPVAMLFARKI